MKQFLDKKKSTMTQNKLDSAYNDLCDVIKKEMVERLPKKHVKPLNSCKIKDVRLGSHGGVRN